MGGKLGPQHDVKRVTQVPRISRTRTGSEKKAHPGSRTQGRHGERTGTMPLWPPGRPPGRATGYRPRSCDTAARRGMVDGHAWGPASARAGAHAAAERRPLPVCFRQRPCHPQRSAVDGSARRSVGSAWALWPPGLPRSASPGHVPPVADDLVGRCRFRQRYLVCVCGER